MKKNYVKPVMSSGKETTGIVPVAALVVGPAAILGAVAAVVASKVLFTRSRYDFVRWTRLPALPHCD
jgi:hypothetical protein